MKLNSATDFSFRLLTYIAVHADRWVSVSEIAKAYGLSQHHLSKISKILVKHEIITAKRGREGGLKLAQKPAHIRLDTIVKIMEPEPSLINCAGGIGGICKILPACNLVAPLAEARSAFFDTLAKYTIQDLVPDQQSTNALKKLLSPTA